LELGEAEYAVACDRLLKNLDDFRNVPVGLGRRRHTGSFGAVAPNPDRPGDPPRHLGVGR